MNEDIDEYIGKCETCCKYRSKQMREPLIQDIQEHSWYKIGLDIFSIAGKDYLIAIDYMSNYPEIAPLADKNSVPVIKALKPIFARHGIPVEVTSDNVPFNSKEFIQFSIEYGFKFRPISPRDSNANGKAEMGVKIIKNLLRKSYDSGTNPYLAIMNYRAAPLECGKTPSELLMGRNIRTRLPQLFRYKPDQETKDKINKIRETKRKL